MLRFSVAEEVRVDELVDHRLVGRINDLELDAHAHAAIAPGHVADSAGMGARSRCRPATVGDGGRPIGTLHLTGHFRAVGACANWAASQVVLAGNPLTFLTLVP